MHRLTCSECRTARRADRMIGMAVGCMGAEPVPTQGLAGVLRALSLSSVTPHRIREKSRRRARRLIKALAVIPALFLLGHTWLWWIDRDPGIRIPDPQMPSPNAFADFRSAGEALTMFEETGKALSRPSDGGPAKIAPLTEMEAIVKQNADALRLLREGFAHEYREPPARSFSHPFPHYAKHRGIARLLAVEAMVHERRGRIAQANASDLDAMDMGMRIRNGGPVIGALVGVGCSAIGRIGLWERLDRMSAQDARAALARLDRIEARRVPVADNLVEEKWCGVGGLLEIMRDPDWRWNLGGLTGTEQQEQNATLKSYGLFIAMLPFSKTSMVERYMLNLDRQVRYARAYPLASEPVAPEGLVYPLNNLLYPVFISLAFKDASDRCADGLLRKTLAVRAYRLEKGRLPRGLQEVVQAGYIEAVPRDPFLGDGSVLRYRIAPKGPVIYSVGPDGVDNGGVPAGRQAVYESEMSRMVMQDSVGDIVAGVNRL